MKSAIFYILLAAAVLAWLFNARKQRSDHDLQASLNEHKANQALGQKKSNARIWAQPQLWSDLINDFDPNIFNSQTPVNATDTLDEESVYGTPIYPEFGATTSPDWATE